MSEGASRVLEELQGEALILVPAMESMLPPVWPGARWIGSVDLEDLAGCSHFELENHAGYEWARLLVRASGAVRGFVDVPAKAGIVDRVVFEDSLQALPPVQSFPPALRPPSITVVVCTRDRTDQLRGALLTILALDYPFFDVVVVDNAPATRATEELIDQEFRDQRIHLVTEPIAGLSHARNTGLRHATGDVVAFTDDDVVVDRAWLREIAAAFEAVPVAACVTGLVPAGEVRSRVQGYFDERVSWSRGLHPRIFSIAEPPPEYPTFPFCIGAFGTGANFALKRHIALELGAFDPALGVGTRTGGGEDIDMFTRVLLSKHSLVVQPSAIVWHRHRDDLGALRKQARSYGLGLGAWIAKILSTPHTASIAFKRSPRAARNFLQNARDTHSRARRTSPYPDPVDRELAKVLRTELFAVVLGPLNYMLEKHKKGV